MSQLKGSSREDIRINMVIRNSDDLIVKYEILFALGRIHSYVQK